MSIPNPTLARVAGTVAALVLIAIATIGVFAGLNGAGEDVAGPAEVTAALAPRTAAAPVAPVATVEIGPDRTGPSLAPFTGEVVLAAYTELTPAEWADGVFAGFAPEPTPAPVAPPVAPAALAPAAPPAAVETPALVESSATQSAAASTESTSVQAAPFDGPIVAESVGPAPTPAPPSPPSRTTVGPRCGTASRAATTRPTPATASTALTNSPSAPGTPWPRSSIRPTSGFAPTRPRPRSRTAWPRHSATRSPGAGGSTGPSVASSSPDPKRGPGRWVSARGPAT